MEDNSEGMKKDFENKLESLESILRMAEIKAKNTGEHGKIFISL